MCDAMIRHSLRNNLTHASSHGRKALFLQHMCYGGGNNAQPDNVYPHNLMPPNDATMFSHASDLDWASPVLPKSVG